MSVLEVESPYAIALLDWLACAAAGAAERAPTAARALGRDLPARVAAAATAGHVLDFDDTTSDGVAHCSAACAPAALVVAADLGASIDAALRAYAAGFEAMAALAAASHPGLYDAGYHPTAVCGPLGAAVAAGRLLGLDAAQMERAAGLALLRGGGTRGAFGSDAKALQVGLAAGAGVQGALLARAGATVPARATIGDLGLAGVLPVRWPPGGLAGMLAPRRTGIEANWIKLHPSCLGTHAPIDAALRAAADADGAAGRATVEVTVHPVARQAAHIDAPRDGLEAKFSIAYCVSHALRRGAPRVADFAGIDDELVAAPVRVAVDPALPTWGARLSLDGREVAFIEGPRGSPAQPARPEDLAAKLADLAGAALDGVLDDSGAPAASLLTAAGLSAPGAGAHVPSGSQT